MNQANFLRADALPDHDVRIVVRAIDKDCSSHLAIDHGEQVFSWVLIANTVESSDGYWFE